MLLRSQVTLPWVLAALVSAGCERPQASTEDPRPPATSASANPPAPAPPTLSSAGPAPHEALTLKALPLPGATPPASLDYIAYEGPRAGRSKAAGEQRSRVWVPVGATGSVDVLDVLTGLFTRVDGFPTAEREVEGRKRVRGPSSVAISERFAYVGDRATNEVCPVNLETLTRLPCLKIKSDIDGLAYVGTTHEVWVTTPDDQSLTILETSASGALSPGATVKVGGESEGYAVDESHGLFLTNLEDKGGTVVIDVKKRAVTATWDPACGAAGPRGVAVDEAQRVVLVACTDHIQALDAAAEGALLGRLDTGPGVDNIDFVSATRRLYIAAGKAAQVTVAQLGEHGRLSVVSATDTREGARNAVADAMGNVYIGDSAGASLLVLSSTPR